MFLSDYASPRARLLLSPWVTDVANSQSSATLASACTNLQARKSEDEIPRLHEHSHGASDVAQNARRNFAVGDALIMGALSSITASQTGNQVVVSMSSFLISAH